MDFEQGLIAAILRQGFIKFQDLNIDLRIVSFGTKKVIEFIEAHYNEHLKTPSIELIEKVVGGSLSSTINEPIEFWIEHLRRKYANHALEEMLVILNERDASLPYKAVDEVQAIINDINLLSSTKLQMIPIMSSKSVDNYFEEIWKGEKGLPTPWPKLNDCLSGGFKPEELIVIAARPGVGKSMALLLMCNHLWKLGNKILFVSTEMSTSSVELRSVFFAGYYNSYGKMKKGMIDENVKDWIVDQIKQAEVDGSLSRYQMMGDGFDVYLETIEAKIPIFKPDLVAIDGTYLLKCRAIKDTDKYRRIAETFDRIKAMAKRHKVAIVVTTQLNRAAKGGKNQKVDLDRLAFSDNVGMVADYVFFINADENMKADKELEIEKGKLREADDYSPLRLNWNFETGDFTEKEIVEVREEDEEVSSKKKTKKTKYNGSLSDRFRPPED